MTSPHDTRAPHRQQRWVELHNVDYMEIDAYGCVEIVGNEVPEGDAARTVLQVRRPTTDSCPHVMLNGINPIPAGGTGQVGTNDYPAWARFDGPGPVPGEMWGSVANSFAIGKGRQGFVISGETGVSVIDQSTLYVRVMRAERLLRVQCDFTNYLPGSTQRCLILAWDGTAWQPTNSYIVVSDPMFRACAIVGEQFWAEPYSSVSYQIASEYGLRRRAKVISAIYPNSTGLVVVGAAVQSPPIFPTCVMQALYMTVEACYRTSSTQVLQAGEEVFVHYHPEFRAWFILPAGGASLTISKLKATACFEPGTSGDFKLLAVNDQCEWEDTGVTVTGFDEDFHNFLLKDEIVFGVQRCAGIYDLIGENGLSRLAKVNADIPCSSGGQVTVLNGANYSSSGGSCEPPPSECVLGVCNGAAGHSYSRCVKEGEFVHIRFYERNWHIIPTPANTEYIGTLAADMCPNDTSAEVTNMDPLEFCFTPKVTTVTGINLFGLAGQTGDVVLLKRNWVQCGDPVYYITQVEHQSGYYARTSSINQDSCVIRQVTTREEIAYMGCGNTLTDTSNVTFTEETFITGFSTVQPGSADTICKIMATTRSACMLPGSGAGADVVVATFTPMLTVQDVFQDGLCIKGLVTLVYVLCFSDEDEVTFLCGTDCSSGS